MLWVPSNSKSIIIIIIIISVGLLLEHIIQLLHPYTSPFMASFHIASTTTSILTPRLHYFPSPACT